MSKRKFLTLDDHIKVIKLSEAGKSSRSIAEEIGVGRTQVQNIIKRKREVLEEHENNHNSAAKRFRRTTTFEDLNELLLNWFRDATSRQINVSGPLLKQEALGFDSELGLTEFKALNGWLECFLKRYNIIFKKMSGERGAVNPEVVEEWKKKIPSLCELVKVTIQPTFLTWTRQVFSSETQLDLLISRKARTVQVVNDPKTVSQLHSVPA